jgi:DNA-directed RNA polymerase I, II, and III subunit RPABC2
MSDYEGSDSEYENNSVVSEDETEMEIRKTKKPINSKNGLPSTLDDDSDGSSSSSSDNEDEDISNFGEDSDVEIDGFSDTEYEDGEGDEDMEDEPVSKKKIGGVTKGKKQRGGERDTSDDGSNKKDDELQPEPVVLALNQDEDEEEEEDLNYMQKFDKEIRQNYLTKFHPECEIHNYDEVEKMTVIIRDANNNIIDPLHKTLPYLTKYERTRILGQRAKQIEHGAKPFVTVEDNIIDGYLIAEMELKQKKIPFIIRRPLPNGSSEYWNVKDLEII